MRCKSQKQTRALILSLLLFFFLSLAVKPSMGQETLSWKWSPQIAFRLSSYNRTVKFNDYAYFNSFSWDYPYSSEVTFHNLLVGSGTPIEHVGLASVDSDVTVLSADSKQVKVNLADTSKTLYVYDVDIKNVQVGGSWLTKNDFFTNWNEWESSSGDAVFQNSSLTAIRANSSFAVTLGFEEPPNIFPITTGIEKTLFLRADSREVNGIVGYKLSETQSSGSVMDSVDVEGAYVTYYGVRVWVVHHNGATEELTSGVPAAVVTRNADGEGLQNATWLCPGYNSIVDAVMVKVYQRFGTGDWNLRASFITENDFLVKLPEATWTFSYYTIRQYADGATFSTLVWGGSYMSSVTMRYDVPAAWEVQFYNLFNGDIFGFLFTPYTWFLGFLGYSLVFLFPLGIVLYNRFEDATATIIALLLIGGGAGGLLSMLVPQLGLQLCWALFVLGIAALLYRLVTS